MVGANLYVGIESLKSIIITCLRGFDPEQAHEQTIVIPIVALAVKFVLFCIYRPIRNLSTELYVLYEDQKNDVLLGISGLASYFIGSNIL